MARDAHTLAQEAWERIEAAYAWGDGFQAAYGHLVALFVEAGAKPGGGAQAANFQADLHLKLDELNRG